MKLNPQQAPLYGECLLTVQLCDEERFQDEEDVEFYLLFSGTTQRHLTSTLRISHVTLQAICPAHDCCESVQVTLCSAKPGRPVDTVAEERFQFVQDLAFDMAQFLVSTAGQDDGLEGALLLDECQIPLQECERLDESLALALRHLTLPEGWSVLGTNLGKDFVPAPQETLLHFAARRGLRRVAVFLLQQPGGKEALRVPNKQGATPASVAENRGHRQLQQLLTPEETAQRTRTEGSVKISEGRVVRHHRKLNTYTLTVDTKPGYPLPSLQSDVEELRRVIHCHVELKGALSSQPEYESPWPTQENSDSQGSAIEESCLDQLQHDSVHTTEQRSEEAQSKCIGQPSQAGPDPGPDASEPCSGNGDVGESVHPCQSSSGEEEGVVPTAVSVGDSGKVLDKSDTTQSSERPAFSTPSCGKQEEEADIVWDIISVPQSSTEGLDNGRPEEERGEERTGKTKGQTDSGAPSCSGNGPAEADMGHAQSQEQLETADADAKGREPSQEAEQDGEKAKGTASDREGEPESESERPLSSPAPAENGQEDSKEMQDVKPYPECPQSETVHLICCEKEPKVAVNVSEQSQEAAAVNCSKEKEGGDSEEKNNLTPQPEKGVCEESCASPETETGNLKDEANGSTKSAHSTGAEPLQPESTEECLTQAGEEGSSVDANPPVSVRLAQDDDQITCDPQTESAESKDKLTDHGGENTTEECQQENQRGVPECQVESTEVQLTQNDVTSSSSSCHSQVASSSTDKREGDAIPEGFASSSENFLSSTSPVAEPLHLPPASGDTSTMQEASSLGQEETSMASQMDQALNLSDSVSNFEATNKTEKEEEESMISPIIEPDLQLLPSEDTKETLKLEFPPELLQVEPEKEGKQSEQIQECVESEIKQEKNDSNPGVEVCESNLGVEITESSLGAEVSESNLGVDVTDSNMVAEVTESNLGAEVTESNLGADITESNLGAEVTERNLGVEITESKLGAEVIDSNLRVEVAESKLGAEVANSNLGVEVAESKLGVEVTAKETAKPYCSQGGENHGEGTALPGTHTETEEEMLQEEEGDTRSTQDGNPESLESGVSTKAISIKGGHSGPGSISAVLEHSGEDILEQTVDKKILDAKVKEGSENVDSESVEDEVIVPSLTHHNSTEGETTLLKKCPETCETVDLEYRATPVNCDSMTSSITGFTSLTDRANNLASSLERVDEEESEEIGESKPVSEEISSMTKMEEKTEAPDRDVVDGPRESTTGMGTDTGYATKIHREKDTFYSIDPCGDQNLLEKKSSSECPESPLCQTPGSSVSTTQLDSVSDADGFFSTDTGEDSVFRKTEDTVTGDSTSEVSVSCSSTDDTASVGPPSSTPDSCADGNRRWSSEEARQPGAATGGEAEEEKDRLTEVPVRSAILRPSIRSLSPFRRHSWGPGKNQGGEAEMNQRSSLRSLGDGKSTFHRRSMSWCPSEVPPSHDPDEISSRSYSLEGLTADRDGGKDSPLQGASPRDPRRMPRQESEERGSLVSLTEEEQESDLGECSSLDSQQSGGLRPARQSNQSMTLPLTKSVSMLAISQKELDVMGRTRPKRRISFSFSISPILPKSKTVFSIGSSSSDEEESCSMRSFSSASGSLGYSISEEDPGPLRSDSEGKGGTKVSRTFSYLKSKMYKKTKEKDKDRSRDKEKEAKEREKRTLNGHLFSALNSALPVQCYQCNKAINTKDASYCTYCNAYVHKGCKEILPVCTKVKMKQQKQQLVVTDSAAMPPVTLRNKTMPSRERPWSAISAPDEPALVMGPRRHTSIMTFNSNLSSNLSKSISISNIAGPVFDEMPLKGLRYLSQSTDSLHKTSKVNESTESLTDEGTEMMDSQLMGEFEADAKELEADSWSCTQDKKYLKQLKKDVIKRQDVIYELIQTEMHHLRTLKIMADVYSKGLLKEVQLEVQTVERVFPVLDDLLDLHTNFFSLVLERKKEAQKEGKDGNFIIRKVGDVLVTQFSGSNAERMKKVYGKFCSRHNEAVNFYKELHTKDKRFQAFIKKKMSSTIVRRLGIPECILLVTQRITKYPVLLQRILEHTKENEEDHGDVTQALRLVKEVIAAVDSKVNEHEKKRRLKEVYSRTDSKSIMRMKSGQMFAREDLVRGRRRLLHDGPLQLKNSAGRLKEVQALLLSDIFVFLQEKDQKYVFASLDQRSTVISLQKLIVREVANEEKGLFLITAGIEKPEMVEVYASSKEERNTWMQLIQEAMHSMEKDEDEGIPSETEEDKRLLETKAKEMRDLLRKKDEQIVVLLEEKVKLFRDMCDCGTSDDSSLSARTLFRANAEDMPKGEPVMKDALKEVETLQTLVNGSLGGAMGQLESAGGSVGPVCLPRRAETFGGFDSHQMNISKNGDKDEGEDSADLRRTESDSVLKKGGNANLLLLLKRNSEQVLHSVTHLHDLLNTLQAVVVQQDTFIEDQRQALSERPASRPSSRPSSLIEQEKQRSLEKQRQEVANLQRQQAAHAEERRRREREWEAREQALGDREAVLHMQEEEAQRKRKELEEERQELQARKEEYQKDLERLRDAQRKLEKDKEQVRREQERIEQIRLAEEKKMCRTPSTTSEDSLLFQSSSSLDRDMGECELSSSPRKDSFGRMDSKRKVKNFFPATSNASQKAPGGEGQNQIPNRLMSLAKSKDKKDKKKKKGKGHNSQPTESPHVAVSDQPLDGEIFFC